MATVKQYAFPSEEIAKELILDLASENNELTFDKITGTETTYGIVCLGFQHKYEVDLDTDEHILVKEATTYDVDVAWKEAPNEDWTAYEVEPKTPNHVFA